MSVAYEKSDICLFAPYGAHTSQLHTPCSTLFVNHSPLAIASATGAAESHAPALLCTAPRGFSALFEKLLAFCGAQAERAFTACPGKNMGAITKIQDALLIKPSAVWHIDKMRGSRAERGSCRCCTRVSNETATTGSSRIAAVASVRALWTMRPACRFAYIFQQRRRRRENRVQCPIQLGHRPQYRNGRQ